MHFSPACFPLCKMGTILAAPFQGSWVPVKREAPLSPQPGPRVRAPESGHAGALCCAQPGPAPALAGLCGDSSACGSSANTSDSWKMNPSTPPCGHLFGRRPARSASPLRAAWRSYPCCARRLAGSGPCGLWTAPRGYRPGPELRIRISWRDPKSPAPPSLPSGLNEPHHGASTPSLNFHIHKLGKSTVPTLKSC